MLYCSFYHQKLFKSCQNTSVGYNYYDHTITRTTPAQNPTTALSVMQIKGSHLGFYIDFMVIFKTGGRNEFLTPKYPRIEVLFMIVAPEDQFLH